MDEDEEPLVILFKGYSSSTTEIFLSILDLTLSRALKRLGVLLEWNLEIVSYYESICTQSRTVRIFVRKDYDMRSFTEYLHP